ncbi:MAG: bifunctional UDP-sugar hydrolase/5'-nucleotidase [Hyphomonadaceae bacterium]
MPGAARFALLIAALFAASCVSTSERSATVELHLLAINDFHGNLESPQGGTRILDAQGQTQRLGGGGSAARLATLVAERRAAAPHAIMVAGGDLIGASPMLSALFHDEPTVEAMGMMGLSLSAVGNHEFDEGAAELLRMQNGGCHPLDGCRGPAPFTGARYQYLAASTIVDATGETLFPASAVRTFDGIRVGFIGLTLEGTPEALSPAASAGLTFRDEIETINAEAARLRAQGIEAIVVLIHEGGARTAEPGDCPGLSGDIAPIVEGLDASVDVVVSGHTNGIYICRVGNALLTSAGQYGAYLTDITLTLDRRTGDVVASAAQNIVVAETIAEDASVAAHVAAYSALAAPIRNRAVGAIAAPLPRARTDAGESPLGLVIADSMIAGVARELGSRPDIAFMNPGGVRADLASAGPVTLDDLFAVLPFGNDLMVLELTGAEIETLLTQQFRGGENNTILQISEGSRFAWRRTASGGTLVPGSIVINGAPLDRARTYRVVTNSFLAFGGDGFNAFAGERTRTVAGGDLAALETYVAAYSPLPAPSAPRVRIEQ